MTCRAVTALLADRLAGALDAATAGACDAHADACGACRAYRRAYRDTLRLTRLVADAPPAPRSAALPEDLVAAIVGARDAGCDAC